MQTHVIICGLGHIGFRVFELLNKLGEQIAIISDTTLPAWKAHVEASGAVFLEGDARDSHMLKMAGIQDARAIIAVTDQDLVNLSVAMDARKLNPAIKVVLRLFDHNLGSRLAKILDLQQVLSTSAIAAPIFTSGIFGDSALGCLLLGQQQWVLSEIKGPLNEEEIPDRAHETRHVYTSIPLLRYREGKVEKCDEAPPALLREEAVLVLKEALQDNAPTAGQSPWLAALRGVIRLLRNMQPTMLGVMGALLGIVVMSVVVFHFAVPLAWVDALYFVITTITTVGYGDLNFSNTSFPLKIYGCFLMLCGAAILATLFGVVTDLVLSARLREVFGSRSIPTGGHTVLVGLGNIGYRIASALADLREEVVLITNEKEDRFFHDIKYRVAIVEGDPRNEETLKMARVHTAKAVVAVTEEDILNLSVGLMAQEMNQHIWNIVRVFDAEVAQKLGQHMPISKVLSVSATAAPMFVGAVIDAGVQSAIVWHDHLVLLSAPRAIQEQHVVPSGGFSFTLCLPISPTREAGLAAPQPLGTEREELTVPVLPLRREACACPIR